MSKHLRKISRRRFLATSTAAASAFILSDGRAQEPAARRVSKKDKLNIAVVGAGGRGADDLQGVSGENIVALCDVDSRRAADSFSRFPNAKQYQDWRKLLEAEKNLDAVVVATPDHNHAIIAIHAMRLGKHDYCEKPLAHSIWEARTM